MMRRIGPLFLYTLLALLAFALPEAALAQTPPPAPGPCDQYVGLTNHIAGCIRDTLETTVGNFFTTNFYDIFKRATKATMIIAVAIFGVMASFGMLEKAGRDAIMLLIKIAFVSYFVTSSDDLYNVTMLLMDGAGEAVVSYVPTQGKSDNSANGDFNQITCLKNLNEMQPDIAPVYIKTLGKSFNRNSVAGPWLAMDCILDSVIGIRVATKNPIAGKKPYNETFDSTEKGPSRGLLYFFFSSMQSSVMGLLLAAIGFIFIWGVVNLVIKALFIYLAGYIGLAVLMVFAPLFIPMVLFQSTKTYFDKWIKLIISFALQPIIILVFVSFSIAAVDLAVFSAPYSVTYRLAGEASKAKGFSLNRYLTCMRSPTDAKNCIPIVVVKYPSGSFSIIEDTTLTYGKVKADNYTPGRIYVDKAAGNTIVEGLDESKCIDKFLKLDPKDPITVQDEKKALKLKCDQSYPLQVFRKNILWDKLAQVRDPVVTVTGVATPTPEQQGEQISKEVFAAIIFAGIVVFVMNQLLQVIPMVAYDLVGDFGMSPNLAAAGGVLPGQSHIRAAMQEMVSKR